MLQSSDLMEIYKIVYIYTVLCVEVKLYIIAKKIVDYVNNNKCDLPADLFHKALITRIGLPYYWCHPCIATQGTHNGIFPSSICAASAKKQHYRAWTWQLKLAYKKLLYLMR